MKTTRNSDKSNELEKSVTAVTTKIKSNSSKLPAKTLESNKIIQKKISGSKIDKSIKSSTVTVAAAGATTAVKVTKKNVTSLKTNNISKAESRNSVKLKLNTVKNSSSRSIPIKANYIPQKPVITDHNVMNTIHNVTVQSPPSKRKEIFENENIESVLPIPRDRTKTRTLEPDEILILKKNIETKLMMNTTTASASYDQILESETMPEVSIFKEPISFEINFDKPMTSKALPLKENVTKKLSVSSNSEYESDFESYASDFESEHSSVANSISKSEDQDDISDTLSFVNDLKEYENIVETKSVHKMQPTKNEYPVNINVKKDEEKKLDSGNYDLKSQLEKLEINSVDEKDSISETQIDSGFE